MASQRHAKSHGASATMLSRRQLPCAASASEDAETASDAATCRYARAPCARQSAATVVYRHRIPFATHVADIYTLPPILLSSSLLMRHHGYDFRHLVAGWRRHIVCHHVTDYATPTVACYYTG